MNNRLQELFGLSGKTAVVTGGSRGIGEMIAEGMVDAGADVIITARKLDTLEATAERLGAKGKVTAIPGDLSTPEGITEFVGRVTNEVESLDILVNNAGANWGSKLGEYPVDGWDKVMNVNLRGVYYLTEGLVDLLRAAGTEEEPARIINVGSIDGMRACELEHYAYSASKAAVHHLTRQLARRLAPEHVLVNAIAPGPFRSKMMDFVLGSEEGRAAVSADIPIGRIGHPDDMAGATIFLASKAGAYLTGVTVPVAGGVATADY